MIDPERSELFETLSVLAKRYPHWRIGQLVANVTGWSGSEVWDVEDDQLLAAAREHLQSTNENLSQPLPALTNGQIDLAMSARS